MKIKVDNNLLDYSTWQTGQTGSVGQFTQYSDNSLNSRINYTNPFGNIGIAWKTNAVNTGLTYFRAGFNTTNITIDNTKSYRCSLWVKKNTDTSAASKCYLYTGVQAYASDGTTLVNTIDLSTGTQNSNQQGITIQTPVLTANTWYLYNYTIRPTTWTGNTDATTTGIYIPSGYKLVFTNEGIGDYKFLTGTTYVKFKGYFPFQYATADLNADYEILYPRIDLIDGTEPSITTLLAGEGPWREVANVKIKVDNNLLNYYSWQTGQTGTIGQFTEYTTGGGLNSRVLDTGPFGTDILWQTISGVTGATMEGGWNMTYNSTNRIAVDPTKNYRHSVWIKRRTSSAGGILLGPLSYNSVLAANDFIRVDTGANITSGWQFNHTPPNNNWCLYVTYIFNSGYTTGSTLQTSWYSGGTSYGYTGGVGDYKFLSTTAWIHYRLRSPFSGDANSSYQMCYPRIDLIDGTEPSIATLLAGEGTWRDISSGYVNLSGVWKSITGTTW